MSWKKLITGEPMPDKNDPKYKERYEREVEAGRRFANATGITYVARRLQEWGQAHKISFLVIVFGIVLSCFFYNVARMVYAYQHSGSKKAVAVERLDDALQQRLKERNK